MIELKTSCYFSFVAKARLEKKKVVYTIELECIFLLQDSNLIIITQTDAIADNISISIIYTNLIISIKKKI